VSTHYQRIMRYSGLGAGLTTAAYTVGASMAMSDGNGFGIEIPRPLNTLALVAIVCGTIVSGAAWVVDRHSPIAAERDMRPVIEDVLRREFDRQALLFTATICNAITADLEAKMRVVAKDAGRYTIAGVREAITADLTEITRSIYRRGQVTGAVIQAESSGKAVVKPIRQWRTSEGD
jgi:hypothetical protein